MEKIISSYKFISHIEDGGMGTVFKGEHLKLNRLVAIKQLHNSLTLNPQFKERFMNEAKILAKLNHPNIVTIYDLIVEDNQYYIVMEYIDGYPLDNLIKEYASGINEHRTVKLFKQILFAFNYAHKIGIIHRDIKPSNIMIDYEDNAKILDFGIAKLVTSDLKLTKAGTKMGSIFYMSPEQIHGYEVDNRSDIYSLGILLFEMLTGKIPYKVKTNSEYEIMNEVINQQLQPVSYYNPTVSRYLDDVITKACSKDINYRFQSCEEFGAALINTGYYNMSKTRIIEDNSGPINNQTIYQQPTSSKDKKAGGKKSNLAIIILIISITLVSFAVFYFVFIDNSTKITVSPQKSISNTNSGNTDTKQNQTKQNTQVQVSEAVQTVKAFITDLGNQNFSDAYDKQKNKAWGTYSYFSSTKAFGGITSTEIHEANIVSELSDEATVYIDYTSYDPYNKNGRYKQNFDLKKTGSNWYIIKVRNILVNQWNNGE